MGVFFARKDENSTILNSPHFGMPIFMFSQFRMGCKNSSNTEEINDFAMVFEQFALSPKSVKQYHTVKCRME